MLCTEDVGEPEEDLGRPSESQLLRNSHLMEVELASGMRKFGAAQTAAG
jgi:hypothetical protein